MVGGISSVAAGIELGKPYRPITSPLRYTLRHRASFLTYDT